MWYNERDDGSPQGGILLKDAPEMIAVGQVSLVEFSPCFLKKGFSDTYLQLLVQSILLLYTFPEVHQHFLFNCNNYSRRDQLLIFIPG